MRSPLIRAAAPLRASRLRLPTIHIHQPRLHQSFPSPISQSSHSSKSFSTNVRLHAQNSSPSKPPLPPNPSFGATSFKELGATRTVKIVVYTAVFIIGTAETFTWSKFLWAKFGPKEEDAVVEIEK
ncbi:hypothetical protein BKA64DRAFT_699667 [Cadophora sp. MPI-SDFR-AT-0126]|nr:hypothetical protein BKA64DRAFT_699667 [Leotiomycetes sp. MPI-SDFR-AT-0126]